MRSFSRAFATVTLAVLLTPGSVATQGADRKTANIVLVTLDGARWQEVFSGLDEGLMRAAAPAKVDITTLPVYKRFWAATPEERRAKLMPFLWGALTVRHGSIAGNRAIGSQAAVTNRHWFSYPGYSEILTGEAHDDTINSNDAKRNAYPSVLQFLRRKLGLSRAQVATFASWYVFPWIVESEEGQTIVNAGLQPYDTPTPEVRALNPLVLEAPTPWEGVRHDVYTLRFGLDYLRRAHPRVLYFAFDEMDDWAHDGRYDRVLESLHRTDDYLRQIWEELQRQPQYRGRTTLMVTVDHGRGRTPEDWRNHGIKVPGADEIWMAFASPDAARRGEWRNHPPILQNQIAATMAHLLGVDYREQNANAGPPIMQLFDNVGDRLALRSR
jgi:hypothetical protein